MRPEIAAAQRARNVRAAARSWAAAGLIDGDVAEAISAAFPDDRTRVGRAARVLFFLFTAIAVLSLFGWLLVLSDGVLRAASDQFTRGILMALSLGFGLVLVALAELLTGPLRRAETGAEEAAALLGVGFLIGAAETALSGESGLLEHPLALLRIAALLCAAAAWRWGGFVFGAAAAAAAFLSTTRLPAARWLWALAAVALLVPLLRAAESARLAPAQRRAVAAALCVTVVAGYAALHPSGAVGAVLESAEWAADPAAPTRLATRAFPDLLARAGILLGPLALVALGIRWRRRLALDLGFLLVVLSVIWLVRDAGWGPAWLLILLGGGIAIALALALRRYLDTGPGHERHGLTAETLAGESTAPGTLEVAATLLALAPGARPAPPAPPEIEGQGGEFGGGGASSTF